MNYLGVIQQWCKTELVKSPIHLSLLQALRYHCFVNEALGFYSSRPPYTNEKHLVSLATSGTGDNPLQAAGAEL